MVEMAEDGPKCCFDLAKSIILSRKTYAIIVKMKSVRWLALKYFDESYTNKRYTSWKPICMNS